jgi:phenylalanyl-tRNA synthetase alpha chain
VSLVLFVFILLIVSLNYQLLRTHTSAHQCEIIRSGTDAFLCTGDVYRRDEIDSSHYPAFHQMEGVRLFNSSEVTNQDIELDLKNLLSGLVQHLFGKDCEMRWRDDYFPFTSPSFEVEVKYQDNWLEVLGCGVIHHQVLRNSGVLLPGPDGKEIGKVGWAFGLGLERLAMVLFGIPDIRLFWTKDERFLSQFRKGNANTNVKFVPYSKYPPCYKDISFWLPETNMSSSNNNFHENDLFEVRI